MASKNPYLPHTDADVQNMLAAVGKSSIDELFDDVPSEIRLEEGLPLDPGVSEWEVTRRLNELADRNRVDRISFLGGGCYDHIVPAVVRYVLARPEFGTAYTPYQAEISQGMLQAIFEFQTMMCMLCDLEVSNASLYDGATAVVEACSIGLQANRNATRVVYSSTIHPNIKRVLATNFLDRGVEMIAVPARSGATTLGELEVVLDDRTAAVVLQSPNIFGCLEDLSGFADAVHARGALLIVSANPLSLALFRTPGEWGADIAVGDTQVLGLPPSFGGPSAGYIAARQELLRKMPGRIVGQTVDREGKRAFVLTLQAREQHIKRERATSNICTNQALVALGNAAYLALLGSEGLQSVARQSAEKAHYLHDRLIAELSVVDAFEQPFFNEFTLRLPRAAHEVISSMADAGFLAGFNRSELEGIPSADSSEEELLTIAVTEKRTRDEMDAYVAALKGSL